jgi:hypothetical protein
MVTQLLLEHNATPVKSPEVHIKRVNSSISFVNYDNHRRLIVTRSALGVRCNAFEPFGVLGDLIYAGEVNVTPTF